MKLLIDLPKEKYEWIKKNNPNADTNSIVGTIANGTPYEERPQGEWIPMNPDCRGYSDYFKCSICGAYIYPRDAEKELDYNGCPYCFADMKKGDAEE